MDKKSVIKAVADAISDETVATVCMFCDEQGKTKLITNLKREALNEFILSYAKQVILDEVIDELDLTIH